VCGRGVVRAATLWLRKRGYGRVFAALMWSRALRFDARLRTRSLVPPFAYKYPGIFRAQRRSFEESFRVSFSVYVVVRVV